MNCFVLVNKDNKIKDKYYKNLKLVEVLNVLDKKTKVEEKTYNAYLELKKFLEEKDIIIGIDTAYRDEEEQQETWNYFLEEKGEEYCHKYVAPVGYSEHHTGLAIDISLKKDGKFLIDNGDLFKYDDEFKKIHPYLKEFGFILRYPLGKENITGYNYEPWHIRYVGTVTANIIYENNLTLEEYLTKFGGVLVVNKEKGITSFDVVKEVSKTLGIKKIGHTGTLDPLAEGVLVLTIGTFTKLGEDLTSLDKEYIAEVEEGIITDTLDITGNIIDKNNNRVSELENLITSFKKTYLQEVPVYSAVKVNGKKLYEYARNNLEVELPKKEVTIKEIELLSSTDKTFKFKTLVSKGCYIRSLINDIGNALNTYATMTTLIRTKQGKVTLEDTYKLSEIRKNLHKTYQIDEVLELPTIIVDDETANKIRTGQKISNKYDIKDKVIFKDNKGQILGIYELQNNILAVWKNFV